MVGRTDLGIRFLVSMHCWPSFIVARNCCDRQPVSIYSECPRLFMTIITGDFLAVFLVLKEYLHAFDS